MINFKIPRPTRRGIFLISLTLISVQSSLSAGVTAQIQIPAQGINGAAAMTTGEIKILALRVSFEPDSNLSTSGNGQFLEAGSHDWCDGFIVDPAPHGAPYFYDQLQAVGNFFGQVSHNLLTIDLEASLVYPFDEDQPIRLRQMAAYTTNEESGPAVDSLLVQLAVEAFETLDDDRVQVGDYDMVIMFHAGLGQDFAYSTLDPTPRDLPSSYIDTAMINAAIGAPGIPFGAGEYYTGPVLLVPESQNHLYYDTAQDLFGYSDDLCDAQVGLTGTLTLLMGYGLGFPPLFDTATGDPGVGVFALMDAGSGNGRGVIPAPPDPWTRIYLGWEEPVDLSEGDNTLMARHLPEGKIGKLTLSPTEYLLIENRSNWVGDAVGVDLDSMLFRDAVDIGGYFEFQPYFGYLRDSLNVTRSENDVIISVGNYDWGLPGSGLLIWQVNEVMIPSDLQGLNNDRNNRGIKIIEADGAIDIGFPSAALFERPDLGWRWDMWYAGNEGFFVGNPSLVYDNLLRLLFLDSQTNPPLALHSGATTGLAIGPIGPADIAMTFAVGSDREIIWLQPGSEIVGHNGVDWIHQRNDSLWVGPRLVDEAVGDWQIFVRELDHLQAGSDSGFWLIDTSNSAYSATRYFDDNITIVADNVKVHDVRFDGDKLAIITEHAGDSPETDLIEYQDQSDPASAAFQSWGYLTAHDSIQQAETEYDGAKYLFNGHSSQIPPALADLDGDGLDEVVTIDDGGPGQLGAFNWNGVTNDDWPVFGSFEGPILAANLVEGPLPELIVIESDDIAIFDTRGSELMRFARRGSKHLFLHEDNTRIGLADGDRVIWFEPDDPNPFWLTETAQFSRERISLGAGIAPAMNTDAMDRTRVYNYPNPVLGESTIIRFYVKTASSANIRFYTLDGLKVDEVNISDLHQNDYNEWTWNVSDRPSGLYYALVEVSGINAESALVKIAVIK
ncbi:hypothetical protein ACFL6E_00885 [Candidatus Neomarinimicrobiota bacterium]